MLTNENDKQQTEAAKVLDDADRITARKALLLHAHTVGKHCSTTGRSAEVEDEKEKPMKNTQTHTWERARTGRTRQD